MTPRNIYVSHTWKYVCKNYSVFSILNHFNEINESTQSHFSTEIVWIFYIFTVHSYRLNSIGSDDWNCNSAILLIGTFIKRARAYMVKLLELKLRLISMNYIHCSNGGDWYWSLIDDSRRWCDGISNAMHRTLSIQNIYSTFDCRLLLLLLEKARLVFDFLKLWKRNEVKMTQKIKETKWKGMYQNEKERMEMFATQTTYPLSTIIP